VKPAPQPAARLSRLPSSPRLRPLVLALMSIGSAAPAWAQDQPQPAPPTTTLERVEVIGASPLPGLDLRKDQVAAPVQTATGAQLQRSGATSLGDFANRRLNGVHINEMQGNPMQPDVNFRGYTASPLLGTPQGLSVYMDGVRLNQPFGDVVSWDLIPTSAISTITLMPGSNPLFGLNTLGGALAVETKDGHNNPGGAVEAGYGSSGRLTGGFELGGSNAAGWDWFTTAQYFNEDGWRQASPSEVIQLFSKVGWRDARTRISLTASLANSDLIGNGLQEQRFLQRDYSSVYTIPDQTQNNSTFFNLAATREINESFSFSGNAYYRHINTTTLNGDINDDSLDQSVYALSADDQAALTAAGIPFPSAPMNASNTPFPYLRCVAQVLQNDEPGEKCNGLLTRGNNSQSNYGLGSQLSWHGDAMGAKHLFVAGAALDFGRVDFQQLTQLGYLNPDRSVTGVPAYADGVSGGDVDGEPLDTQVNLRSRTRTWSLFASETASFGNTVNLTVSGRYNHTTVENRDQLRSAPDPASLDGDHTFKRFNPAIGLTWNPSRVWQFYAGYNEGSRAPTAIELGCANPEQPCKLPNSMAGDPPLNQVVTKTIEAGLRGDLGGGTSWHAGVFRADNHDDILFVADDAAGFGYFKNFGKTRRQGVELGAATKFGPLGLSLNYTYVDATYRSAETVSGAGNSTNDAGPGLEGAIQISPGDKIPLIPKQMLKAGLDYDISPKWGLDLDLIAVASSYARGNENNQHEPDGSTYIGPGYSPGYAVWNLGARYKPVKGLTLSVRVDNVLDRQYSTAAQLGNTGFDANGNFLARPLPQNADGDYPQRGATFFAPGAPRRFWVGMRYEFD